ncbi:hypothetical protein [Streptomyces sp. CT34]|uniref:hypothetical protein n=1 Tax=Streptomyces sp. CT34 TaxID=1553907 RepID=UPI0012FEA863|nr:hypothetical protein [Streptomyces sp. CT34]
MLGRLTARLSRRVGAGFHPPVGVLLLDPASAGGDELAGWGEQAEPEPNRWKTGDEAAAIGFDSRHRSMTKAQVGDLGLVCCPDLS